YTVDEKLGNAGNAGNGGNVGNGGNAVTLIQNVGVLPSVTDALPVSGNANEANKDVGFNPNVTALPSLPRRYRSHT
ncbi:hypothetical protein THIOM_002341, partial [Candidatus Thiomargarita nelsonii]